MKRKLLRIYVKSIKVEKNGDLPFESQTTENDEEKNNAIIATLVYPRSGAPAVTSTKYCDLKNGKKLTFDTNDFWKSGLFKEEVQGETILKIMVADRDKISKFSRFLVKLTKTLMGTGFGAVTGGITNVFLGAVVNMALNEYKDSLKIDKDEHIDIIGVAETKIDLDNIEDEITMNLKAPKKIEKSYYKFKSPSSTRVTKEKKTILEKDQDNGTIELQISNYDI
jgi:hypothetical protein